MNFRICGLPAAAFAALHDLDDAQLAARGAVRRIADRKPGFPCRVSLQDAEPGETVLLLNYEHLPFDSPYRSRHAIYVRRDAVEAQLAPGEVPPVLRERLLSLRAYDARGMMRDADVLPGSELAGRIVRMFADPDAAFLHVHNARPGCYAALVERA